MSRTPEDRADRWLRRRESDVPVEAWKGSLRRAYLVLEAVIRDARRPLFRALQPLVAWLAKRLP